MKTTALVFAALFICITATSSWAFEGRHNRMGERQEHEFFRHGGPAVVTGFNQPYVNSYSMPTVTSYASPVYTQPAYTSYSAPAYGSYGAPAMVAPGAMPMGFGFHHHHHHWH